MRAAAGVLAPLLRRGSHSVSYRSFNCASDMFAAAPVHSVTGEPVISTWTPTATVHPALALGLAVLFAVPSRLAGMATLLAALPTGTGPFMLAELYRRPAGVTSAVILMSTLGSLVTLPIIMWLLSVETLVQP